LAAHPHSLPNSTPSRQIWNKNTNISGYLVLENLDSRCNQYFTSITEENVSSAHTILKEVLSIGEYASLAYHYTTVVREINSRDFRGITVPFTTRRYIFTYDGLIKLGIDGSKIRIEDDTDLAVNTGGAGGQGELPVIRIVLPPIKILSHEVIDDSIEVFEQSQSLFNQIRIEDAFHVTSERKRELEKRVMESNVVLEARRSAEQQLGTLLRNLPGIQDSYVIVFVWEEY